MKKLAASALLAASMLCTMVPAHADVVFDGVCNISLKFTFDSALSTSSGPTGATIQGGGSCTMSGIGITSTSTSISFPVTDNVMDVVNASTCQEILGSGVYGVLFNPDPPPASGGNLAVRGNMASMTVQLTGTGFNAAGVLTGGSTSCTSGTVKTFTYAGALAIEDPR